MNKLIILIGTILLLSCNEDYKDIQKIQYDGHSYIKITCKFSALEHDPNCKCWYNYE